MLYNALAPSKPSFDAKVNTLDEILGHGRAVLGLFLPIPYAVIQRSVVRILDFQIKKKNS